MGKQPLVPNLESWEMGSAGGGGAENEQGITADGGLKWGWGGDQAPGEKFGGIEKPGLLLGEKGGRVVGLAPL